MAVPFAPTILAPADGEVFLAADAQTWKARHEPGFAGGTMIDAQLQHRVSGSATTTTVGYTSLTDEVASWTIAGATFTSPDYIEVRFRTATAEGWGPFTGWRVVQAATTPAAPTITTDGTVGQTPRTETWTAADQEAFEIRRVADDGFGAPDTGTVLWTSGTVEEAGTRDYPVAYDTSPATEHLQVRVRNLGLWSDWATSQRDIDYTSPLAPWVEVALTDERFLVVTPQHPTPDTEAAVAAMRIERSQSRDGELWTDAVPLHTGTLAPTQYLVDTRVEHRMRYRYRAVAIAASGAEAIGDWHNADRVWPYTWQEEW